MVRKDDIAHLVHTYNGDFLAGFSLWDGDGFMDWQLSKQEIFYLQWQFCAEKLLAHYQGTGAEMPAIQLAHRMLSLNPWCEAALPSLERKKEAVYV